MPSTIESMVANWIRAKVQSVTPAPPASGFGIFYDKNGTPAYQNAAGAETILAGAYVNPYPLAYWPWFSVCDNRGGDVTVTNAILPLGTISFDEGSNYNPSTYKFTVPIKGIYHFEWGCYSNSPTTSGSSRVAIVSNNGALGMINGNDKSISVTRKLLLGDTVWVSTNGNFSVNYYAAVVHNWFSGSLIKELYT
jgi:hypothetical protein